ncbi:MAG: hypothetical protein GF411_03690 [Candidatus Lokiarchaeota archaeon]|nr:hypothetical protein [Candidatus Lokiarchaeota archaeon]
MDLRKRVLLFYGLALLMLLVATIYGFAVNEILGIASLLAMVFIGSLQARSLMLMLTNTVVHHYTQRDQIGRKYEYTGTETPATMGFVAGIIMTILAVGGSAFTDWTWLGTTPINLANIAWIANAILSFIGAITAFQIIRYKPPEKKVVSEHERFGL